MNKIKNKTGMEIKADISSASVGKLIAGKKKSINEGSSTSFGSDTNLMIHKININEA